MINVCSHDSTSVSMVPRICTVSAGESGWLRQCLCITDCFALSETRCSSNPLLRVKELFFSSLQHSSSICIRYPEGSLCPYMGQYRHAYRHTPPRRCPVHARHFMPTGCMNSSTCINTADTLEGVPAGTLLCIHRWRLSCFEYHCTGECLE